MFTLCTSNLSTLKRFPVCVAPHMPRRHTLPVWARRRPFGPASPAVKGRVCDQLRLLPPLGQKTVSRKKRRDSPLGCTRNTCRDVIRRLGDVCRTTSVLRPSGPTFSTETEGEDSREVYKHSRHFVEPLFPCLVRGVNKVRCSLHLQKDSQNEVRYGQTLWDRILIHVLYDLSPPSN